VEAIWLGRWILSAGLLAAGTVAAQPAPVVISDDDFAPGDWQVDVTTFTGASATDEQRLSEGNPGAYRHMTHTLPGPSSLSANHLFLPVTWDPCVQGPIAAFDYSEDQIEIAPPFTGAAIGSGFMLVRNGTRYFYVGSEVNPFTNLGWRRAGRRCITPEDLANGGVAPDLTSCGTIQFGFLRSNTNSSTSGSIVTTHGIDNWRVVVYPAPNDSCAGGPACLIDAECDDVNDCTTDACVADACTHTPRSCDDGNDCTTDSCAAGGCRNEASADFSLVEAKIDAFLALLAGPACGDEPLVKALAKPLRKKLTKARSRLARADAATKAALIGKLLGRADTLIGVAQSVLAQAVGRGLVSATCDGVLADLLDEIRACAAGIPRP
jgi:hypothetical protein